MKVFGKLKQMTFTAKNIEEAKKDFENLFAGCGLQIICIKELK